MRLDRALPAAIAVLVLAGGALGCGDDDEETTVTETVTASGGTLGPGDERLPPGPDTGDTTTTEGATTVHEQRLGEGPELFSTPSGNIGCHVRPNFVRCDIRKRDWKPTPPSEPCELDYGHGIVATADHAEFVCAGDTTLGSPRVLGYGESSRRGKFTCTSEPAGVTCSHARTGHGFFISRGSFRIF